ncbi:ABC transporter substrate-binding protein [Streptomyces sp. S3(2020)]|uniref:ABC transporter substrate-binding protein n=1 Tax=Streptomyces sp. S3(2020) TaxID=2732044 RepID=UPI001487A2BF|nr:ABC transporter substrate-binding protein [Streptomyces sp. S3(2020)]NNN29176.1 ABC transporter substrate-binding protein [Streptomyces sp. S3(2020)]
MRRRILLTATLTTTSLALAGCSSSSDSGTTGSSSNVVVGSANFSESQLVAEIYAQQLEKAGVKVTRKFNIGSRETYIPALKDGSIGIIPDYQGALLSYLDPKVGHVTASELTSTLTSKLPKGVTMLKAAAAQDVNVLAVRRDTASKYGLTTISSLAPHASKLSEGSAPEWKTRYEGVVGLKSVYGITFKSFVPLDSAGPLTLAALKNGQIDVAPLLSTDPALKSLTVLKDDKGLFLPQNIAPLVRASVNSSKITTALDAVSAKLTTDDLIDMNDKVSNEHQAIATVAKSWLKANNL